MMVETFIKSLNEQIIRRIYLKKRREIDVRAFAIAFPIPAENEHTHDEPEIILNTGESFKVFNDDYPVGFYHHVLRKIYSEADNFVIPYLATETVDINMVCWGCSNLLNMSALDFEEEIVVPSILGKVVLGGVDFNPRQVIREEFNYTSYRMSPEEFIFSLKYRWISPVNKSVSCSIPHFQGLHSIHS